MDSKFSQRMAMVFGTSFFVLAACDEIQSAQSTMVVAGSVVESQSVSLPGQFDVPAKTVGTVYLARRPSATSTEAPMSISGGTVNIASGTTRVPLMMQADGVYVATNIPWAEGQKFTFEATVPGDTAVYGGEVDAIPRVTPTSVTFSPAPTPVPLVSNVSVHPINTPLNVSWSAQNGEYAYLTVLKGNPTNPQQPQVVFETRPKTAKEIIEFIVGDPPTSAMIPASVFAENAAYAVLLVNLNNGTPKTNTFLGSPLLAGATVINILAVGTFRPD